MPAQVPANVLSKVSTAPDEFNSTMRAPSADSSRPLAYSIMSPANDPIVEAVAVLEVYRPKDREDLSVAEKERVEDVVRISLVKNKRPPFRLIDVEMILDPRSGRIVEPDVFDMQHRDWQDEF